MGEDVVLGVEVGGTHTRLLIQARDGSTLYQNSFATDPTDYGKTLDRILTVAELMCKNYNLQAAGGSIAGVLEGGVLTGAGNLPGWVGHCIDDDLGEALSVPAVFLNDAKAAGLGEYTKFNTPLIYVCWGTGIGVSLVFDGHTAHATELGHCIIDRKSRLRCGCGGRGHLEALAGTVNFPNRRFGLRRGLHAEQLNERQWQAVFSDFAKGIRSISTAAPGWPIVIGGGAMIRQQHHFSDLVVSVSVLQSSNPVPELHLARCGEDSGLVGAASMAWQHLAA